MAFDDFVSEMHLTSIAKEQLPKALSKTVKERLMLCPDAESIILAAIAEIEKGGIDTLNSIVLRLLDY